jgi:short-subunit dehydrogenase
MDFKGTRALVTGASSGIGEVFASELAARGANLVLTARSKAKLEALAVKLRKTGVLVDIVAMDLSAPAAGSALAAQLTERGLEIDVLINCAGFGLFAPLNETDPEQITRQVHLNVVTLTELTRALLPGMLGRDRGAIMNVASTVAFQPVPYMSVYGATKAYVLSLTEALWAETRGTNVQVTALCPGATNTAFFDVASENASLGQRMTPQAVVAAAFKGLDRHRSTVIPGLSNRLQAKLPRLLSRQAVARITERIMRPKPS